LLLLLLIFWVVVRAHRPFTHHTRTFFLRLRVCVYRGQPPIPIQRQYIYDYIIHLCHRVTIRVFSLGLFSSSFHGGILPGEQQCRTDCWCPGNLLFDGQVRYR
jgi:hypothetical protein